MRTLVLSILASSTVLATPAVAQVAPINFEVTLTADKLIATPILEVAPIKFDLAKVGATEPVAVSAPESEPSTAEPVKQGFFSANSHVLIGADVITAEYAWAHGPLSGFGFVDWAPGNDFVITDHEVRGQVAGPFYASAELGYSRFGGTMGKVGAGVQLGGLPVVRDSFVYLRAYAQATVFGPDAGRLVGVSWGTKDVRVTKGVAIYASGFADIKRKAPDVIQPQVWVKFDKLPIEVGTEVSIFGKDKVVSAAARVNF